MIKGSQSLETKHSHAKEDTKLHIDADDPTKAITKAELRTLVKRLASTLRTRYGLGENGPGRDAVLCIATGHWQLPTVFFATLAAGGIFSSSNPGSTPSELLVQLKQVSATLIFCTEDTLPNASAAAKLFNLPLSRVLTLSSDAPSLTMTPLSTPSAPLTISPSLLSWKRITDPSALDKTTICVSPCPPPFFPGSTGNPSGGASLRQRPKSKPYDKH
jgi:4-coumarate--CoA ligase